MIVDLTVENDDMAPGDGLHRLTTCRRGVDDGQAAVGQCDAGPAVEPDAGIIRATMGYGVRQDAGDRARFFRSGISAVKKTGDATHLGSSTDLSRATLAAILHRPAFRGAGNRPNPLRT